MGSTKIDSLLKLDSASQCPIWTRPIIDELDNLKAQGRTISVPHYPHSAEDLEIALKIIHTFKHSLSSHDAVVGVVSSVSPWVEYILHKTIGYHRVVTVDYNPPIVCGVPWIESKHVESFFSDKDTYDLLVSFSGIEHSGLGRYGDPINPIGDFIAMEQMLSVLKPGGFLLLGVPTNKKTIIEGQYHRLYGMDRLQRMLHGFLFRGRVWDGHVRGGWKSVNENPKLFPPGEEIEVRGWWQHQQVLILQKPLHPESGNRRLATKVVESGPGPVKFSPPLMPLLLLVLLASVAWRVMMKARKNKRMCF